MESSANASQFKYPELFEHIAKTVEQRLKESGVAADEAASIGFDAAERVREQLGGHQVYVPVGVQFRCSRRDYEIFQNFTGENVPQLAAKYSLTEQRIYQIVKRVLISERARRQRDMFGGENEH